MKGIDGGLARVLEGDFAFMNSGTFLRYLVASNFTNEFGQTKLHVAKECFVPFRCVVRSCKIQLLYLPTHMLWLGQGVTGT